MSGRGNPSSSRQVSDLTPPMTANVSAPDPTAGERTCPDCGEKRAAHTVVSVCPATPDADDASEPLTEAERVAHRWAGVLDGCKATDPRWVMDQGAMTLDACLRELRTALDRDAAREAAAATKARADERERIAQAILDARHGWHNEVQRGFVRASRIARDGGR